MTFDTNSRQYFLLSKSHKGDVAETRFPERNSGYFPRAASKRFENKSRDCAIRSESVNLIDPELERHDGRQTFLRQRNACPCIFSQGG